MYFKYMKRRQYSLFLLLFTYLLSIANAEPVVIKGIMLNGICGKPISSIRMCDSHKEPIPFQIDEITSFGNYICAEGVNPNSDSSNGNFDLEDEIIFLSEDCNEEQTVQLKSENSSIYYYPVKINNSTVNRVIYITNDPSVNLSSKKYIEYDHKKQLVKTPFYYAQFGKDRFHFTKAGIFNPETGRYLDLTNELSVSIYLKALWGLLAIHYDEDNLVCIVNRYKTGPIRLIRGGRFHLNLGLGLKGSNAFVNQICYPQIVKVPVSVHVPIRFRNFFSKVYIELCPVVKQLGDFSFKIPKIRFVEMLGNGKKKDTLFLQNPNNEFMAVTNEKIGYGWILQAKIDSQYLDESGFIFRRPSLRGKNSIDCGYRMMIRDLPKGTYEINNWVLFSKDSYDELLDISKNIQKPSTISTQWRSNINHIVRSPEQKSSGK